MLNRRRFNQMSLGALGLGLASCNQSKYLTNTSSGQSSSNADLLIWWEQGFLPEENEQINQLIRRWEQTSGKVVDLKLLIQVRLFLMKSCRDYLSHFLQPSREVKVADWV